LTEYWLRLNLQSRAGLPARLTERQEQHGHLSAGKISSVSVSLCGKADRRIHQDPRRSRSTKRSGFFSRCSATQLFVEGKIQTRSWDGKDSGQKKHRTEVLVNELSLLGGRGESGASNYGNGGGSSRSNVGGYGQTRPATSEEYYADQGITDDDIPFQKRSEGNSIGAIRSAYFF
jgi:Single-strand binding protein family